MYLFDSRKEQNVKLHLSVTQTFEANKSKKKRIKIKKKIIEKNKKRVPV